MSNIEQIILGIKRSINNKKSPETSIEILKTATFIEEQNRKHAEKALRHNRELKWHHREFQSPQSRPHHLPSSYSRAAYDLSEEPSPPPPWRR